MDEMPNAFAVSRPHPDDRPHVLVSAYAFSPTLGSEFAQGWNYVQQMKQRYRLTVLVGSADGRMGDWTLLDHPEVAALGDSVRIVPIGMDRFCRFIKMLDVRYGMSWLFVLGLRRWHWLAYRKAQTLHRDDPFAAVHQLGPVGFRNPGYLHLLGIPSYWGPIGGFQYIDLGLAFRSSLRYGLTALIRNISTFFSARSAYVKTAIKGFDRLSFATLTNQRNFTSVHGVTGPILSDQAAIKAELGGITAKPKPMTPPLNIVWCGSIDARKNIRLLLDVATCLDQADVACRFTVIGSGRMLAAARRTSVQRNLRNIVFTGQLPRDLVQGHFQRAHVLCFTSLSEANTSTLFEALDAGCIPISLDLDGFSSNISDDIGFRVDPTQRWRTIVNDYARHMQGLVQDPGLRDSLTETIQRNFERFTWKSLADRHAMVLTSLLPVGAGTDHAEGA